MTGKKKYYAVLRGRKPGIYTQWFGAEGAEVQVAAFPGARFKGFEKREEAEAFMKGEGERGAAPGTASGKKRQSSVRPPEPFCGEGVAAVRVYSDGGAIGNPGPGGYGTLVIRENGEEEAFSGGFALTTNNRMELMGAIVGLEAVRGEARPVLLTSDSRYLVHGVEKKWAQGWRARGWRKSDGTPALNADLWERLLDLLKDMQVRFQWVKGHSGHPENERCDALAQAAARRDKLPVDPGYGGGGDV